MNSLKYLTPRDRDLLSLVDNYGILTSRQIHKLMFSGISKRTMLRRLLILSQKGFLQSHSGLPRGEKVWTLTAKSAKVIGSELYIKGLNKNTLVHDAWANDLRVRLKGQNAIGNWKNGHWLAHKANIGVPANQRFKSIVPDGLFTLKAGSKIHNVALELELVAKTKKRYQKILREYMTRKEIHLVWYVVTNKRLGAKLISQLPESDYYRPTPWFYWSHLDEILQKPDSFWLHGKNKSHLFCEFAKSNFPKANSSSSHSKFLGADSGAQPMSTLDIYDSL